MTTIPSLTEASSLGNNDLLVTRKDGETSDSKVTVSKIRTYLGTGDIIPSTDSTYDIGSNLKRWAFMYADEITVGDMVLSGSTIDGDITISGDLTVTGTTTTVNTEELAVSDNIIVVNDGEVGAGVTAGYAGIQVDRGTDTDYHLIYDETTDVFRVGEVGSTQAVATREDSPVSTSIAYWNAAQARFDTTTDMTYSSGITSLNQLDLTVDLAVAHGGTGASTATGARANLGLAIGTNVQGWSASLDDISGLGVTKGSLITGNNTNRVSLSVGTDGYVLTADSTQANGIKWATVAGDMLKSIYDPANIAQQLVGTTATQTLTNKTLTTPTINGGAATGLTALSIKDVDLSHNLAITTGSDLTANRTLTINPGDADRTLTLNGNTTLSGTNTGDQTITLTGDVTGSGTGSFATTIANGAVTNAKVNATAAIDHSKMAALTASRAMVTNGSGFASVSSVTATELGYVSGVTSAIQTQLNGKASLSHTHDAGDIVSGTLPVARGGTGVGTLTADRVIRGNGTSPVISSGVIVNSSDEMYGHRRRVENKTGTTYTLLSTDTGKLITTTAGSQIDVTCPNDMPVGSIFFFIQMGGGKIQLVAASGATLRQKNNHYRTAGQYARMAARVVTNSTGTNAEYVVDGDVA